VEIFVAQPDQGGVVGLQRYHRVDTVALELAEIAEGVAALVEGVEAHRDVVVDRLTGIEHEAGRSPQVPVVTLASYRLTAVGFLERAVKEAATGAAAER